MTEKKVNFEQFEEQREFVNKQTGLHFSGYNTAMIYPTEDKNYHIEVRLNPTEGQVTLTFSYPGSQHDFHFKVDRFGIQELDPEGYWLVLFYDEGGGATRISRVIVVGKTGVASWFSKPDDLGLKEILKHLVILPKTSDFTDIELGDIGADLINEVRGHGSNYEAVRKIIERGFNSQGVEKKGDRLQVLNLVSGHVPEEWIRPLEKYFLKKGA